MELQVCSLSSIITSWTLTHLNFHAGLQHWQRQDPCPIPTSPIALGLMQTFYDAQTATPWSQEQIQTHIRYFINLIFFPELSREDTIKRLDP